MQQSEWPSFVGERFQWIPSLSSSRGQRWRVYVIHRCWIDFSEWQHQRDGREAIQKRREVCQILRVLIQDFNSGILILSIFFSSLSFFFFLYFVFFIVHFIFRKGRQRRRSKDSLSQKSRGIAPFRVIFFIWRIPSASRRERLLCLTTQFQSLCTCNYAIAFKQRMAGVSEFTSPSRLQFNIAGP